MRFVLASQSPARLRTLRDAGVHPEVIVSGVDEDELTARIRADGGGTEQIVVALAEAKTGAVCAALPGSALVLGCDSLLDMAGEAFGKPGEAGAAIARWQRLRGRRGTLWTGHCLHDTATAKSAVAAVSTEVSFAEVSDEEIVAYCRSGEPARVAGGFTIDGLGGWFVESIVGDHHNVVGLSLPTVRELLRELGHSLRDIGYPNG